MKKSIYLILIIPVLFIMGMSSNNINNTNETPKALTEEKDSFSKRGKSDLVEQLYSEAMEENDNLSKLNDDINKMRALKQDSLSSYNHFTQTNNSYWSSAKRHINRLQDAELKQSTLQNFQLLETNYKTDLSEYAQKLKTISTKTNSLDDQLTLMKLYVTEAMMKNYQKNEKPNIKSLENIIKKYDQLIEETKKYTQATQ